MAVEPRVWIDGRTATADDFRRMAMVNYGAVTSFGYAGGGVRGWDMHLERLAVSCRELFSCELDQARLINDLRRALEGVDQAWVRVTLTAPDLTLRAPEQVGAVQSTIWILPAAATLGDGVRVRSVPYRRELAHLKHLGMTGLIHARRQARLAGFDDALLVDHDGAVLEGTLWNVGFVEGDTVVWPEGELLDGVTRRLIARGLEGAGIAQRSQRISLSDLSRFDAAFLCNAATPAAAIRAIDDHIFVGRPALIEALRAAWRAQPVLPL